MQTGTLHRLGSTGFKLGIFWMDNKSIWPGFCLLWDIKNRADLLLRVLSAAADNTKLDSQNFSNHTQFLPCPRTGKGANTKGLIICLCHNDRALSERCRFSLLFWFSETRENQAQVYNQTGKGFRPPTPFDLKLNNFKTVHDCPRYDRQHSKIDVTWWLDLTSTLTLPWQPRFDSNVSKIFIFY